MMSTIDNDNLVKRRGVLKSFARFSVLAALGGLAGFGEAKRRRFVREGKCVGRGVCGGCGEFDGCGLPLAVSEKQSRLQTGGAGGDHER